MTWAAARQALLGLLVVTLSLPPLFALSRALGVGTPPRGGLAILGGSVVLGFAGGGFVGALASGLGLPTERRAAWRRLRVAASLAGLVWGIALCGLALPLYLDGVVDDATDAGTEAAIHRIDPILDHPAGALDQAWAVAGELAQAGAARLPALTLLGWTLLGPVLAAPLETRRTREGKTQP
jgi:hypothetical protein